MAKLLSTQYTLDNGKITTWDRITPQGNAQLYFRKEVDGKVLEGMYPYQDQAAATTAASKLIAAWDKLDVQNFPTRAHANLLAYRAWKQKQKEESKTQAKPQGNFFDSFLAETKPQETPIKMAEVLDLEEIAAKQDSEASQEIAKALAELTSI